MSNKTKLSDKVRVRNQNSKIMLGKQIKRQKERNQNKNYTKQIKVK